MYHLLFGKRVRLTCPPIIRGHHFIRQPFFPRLCCEQTSFPSNFSAEAVRQVPVLGAPEKQQHEGFVRKISTFSGMGMIYRMQMYRLLDFRMSNLSLSVLPCKNRSFVQATHVASSFMLQNDILRMHRNKSPGCIQQNLGFFENREELLRYFCGTLRAGGVLLECSKMFLVL